MFSSTFFSRYCGHICVTYIILNEIIIIFNPFNAELNPICQLLALLGAHHILHVSKIRVNWYGATATQLTTFVQYVCILVITISPRRWPQLRPKHVSENIVNETHHKH